MPIHGPSLFEMLEREIELKPARGEIQNAFPEEDYIAYSGALQATLLTQEIIAKTIKSVLDGKSFPELHHEITSR